jgi:hypothetical protein
MCVFHIVLELSSDVVIAAEFEFKKITYILSILSASECKKTVSKHIPKTESFHLNTDKPWDTLIAQMLAKISSTLRPQLLNIDNYDIMFYIT